MKTKNITDNNISLMNKYLDYKKIHKNMTDRTASFFVKVVCEKSPTQTFEIRKREAIDLLKKRVGDLEDKLEML